MAPSSLRVLLAIVVLALGIGAGAATNATAPRRTDFGWTGYAPLNYSTFLGGSCGTRSLETGSPPPPRSCIDRHRLSESWPNCPCRISQGTGSVTITAQRFLGIARSLSAGVVQEASGVSSEAERHCISQASAIRTSPIGGPGRAQSRFWDGRPESSRCHRAERIWQERRARFRSTSSLRRQLIR